MPQHPSFDPREIYYGVDGERHGPVDLERVRQLVEHDQLRADDYIWISGEDAWVEAREVPEIASLFEPDQLRAQQESGPEVEAEGGRYAGFWIRLAAHIIDGMVLFLPSLFWFTAAMSLAGIDPELLDTERLLLDPWAESNAAAVQELMRFELIAWGGFWFMDLLYRSLLESSAWQATVGKRLFGLVVTDREGRRLSLARAALRHVAKIASQIPLNLGFVVIAFHEKKQGLHDLLAQTYVVRR